MPRPKDCLSTKLDRAIKGVGDKSIVRKGEKLFCNKCGINIAFKDKFSSRIKDHLGTQQHISASNDGQTVQTIDDVVKKMNEKETEEEQFRDRLLTALTCSNIPVTKLLLPSFRNFIQWLVDSQKMEVKVPHPRTLNRNLGLKCEKIVDKIKRRIDGKDVYILIDETPDAESRNVINVMVGVLDGQESKPMLVNVTFKKHVNNVTIQKVVMETCAILWPSKVFFPHLKLIVSDQAAYMLLAVRKLKENVSFPNLLHVTCIIHAVHLVCDSIRKTHSTLNTFFSREKKVFKNSGKKKRLFKSITGLNIIPFPILIRWGSWLKCVNYHSSGTTFEKIKSFFNDAPMNGLPLTDDVSVIKQMLKGRKVADDLVQLSKYSELPSIITKLETRSLPLSTQMKLLNDVQDIIRGTVHEQVLIKSLKKNPDFSVVTNGTQTVNDRLNFMYCPLVNCELERSFSVYRDIPTEKRRSLKCDTIRSLMIIKCNSDL